MRNIYNAKTFVEEILLGSNVNGMGFINESARNYFQKAQGFYSYRDHINYSDEVISVGLLQGNLLEIGVNNQVAQSPSYCNCLKNDVCRKLMVPEAYVRIQPKAGYASYLNLNAGNKIAHRNLAVNSGWGTLGGFLLPNRPGDAMQIVSNNHVLANSNQARRGDDIYYMNGGPIKIGTLKNFTNISSTSANMLDLAVAEIPGFVNKGLTPSGNRTSFVRENVYKVGAKTGMTYGIVRSLNYTAKIDFGDFKAVFVDQMQITSNLPGFSFSQPGDSGSLIRSNSDNSFLGLLFAGNGQWTLVNHQSQVIEQLRQWGYNVK